MISQTDCTPLHSLCYEGMVRVDVRLTRGMYFGCFANKGDGTSLKRTLGGMHSVCYAGDAWLHIYMLFLDVLVL